MSQKTSGQILREFLFRVETSTKDLGRAIDSQKETAEVLLERLSIIDPDVLLAGGALRNWDDSRLAKDLDIYIQGKPTEDDFSLTRRISLLFEGVCTVKKSEGYYSNVMKGIFGVLELEGLDIPVQLILCDKTPWTMVSEFDCSLSKIQRNRHNYTARSPEYLISRKYKVILLSKDCSESYTDKMKIYYPDYDIQIEK